jgi:hypothetical protein
MSEIFASGWDLLTIALMGFLCGIYTTLVVFVEPEEFRKKIKELFGFKINKKTGGVK